MKKKHTLIVLLCVFTFAYTEAQEVNGCIKNSNLLPIENALIILQHQTSDELLSTKSNAVGCFSFKSIPEGIWQIQIKAIGHNTYKAIIDSPNNLELGIIHLQEEEYSELAGITINVDKPIIKNTAEGIAVNIADSYLKTLATTMDVLAQIPEIFIQDEEISILEKSKIGYFINGKQAALNLSNIPVASIDRIELITNPSAKYDANIEAVIHIILKKSTTQGIDGEISGQYEQRTASNYSVNGVINYNKNLFNSTFTIGHSYNKTLNNYTKSTHDFYGSSPPFTRESSRYRTSNSNSQVYGAEMSLNFEDGNVLSLLTTWQPNYIPSYKFEQENIFKTALNTDSISNSVVDWKYHTRYFNSGLKYDFKIKKWSLSSRFDLLWQDDATNTYNDFNFEGFNSVPPKVNISTDQFRKSTAYVPSLDASYSLNNHQYDFGVKYYHIKSLLYLDFSEINRFTPPANFDYDANENIFAVYGLYSSQFKNLKYQLGLRGEFSTLNGNFNIEEANQKLNKLLPSANLNYKLNESQSVQLSYTEKIQRPPFSRISPLYYFTSPFDASEGNPYLLPEKATSLQLKYTYKRNALTVFYNDHKNTMEAIPLNRDNAIVQKYSNADLNSIGALASLVFKHTSWLDGFYTFRINQQRKSGFIDGNDFELENFYSRISITENIKFDDTFKMSILFIYTQPSLRGLQKVKERPNLNFSFNKSFDKNLQLSIYLRDIFKIANKTTITRDLDEIYFNGVNTFDSRGINFSLSYKFNDGKKTDTKKLNPDETRQRL